MTFLLLLTDILIDSWSNSGISWPPNDSKCSAADAADCFIHSGQTSTLSNCVSIQMQHHNHSIHSFTHLTQPKFQKMHKCSIYSHSKCKTEFQFLFPIVQLYGAAKLQRHSKSTVSQCCEFEIGLENEHFNSSRPSEQNTQWK